MEDRVKVASEAAAMRVVAMHLYRCRADGSDGERIDHIAARGKCKKLVVELGRITAPHRERNEPCLFITNFQVID